MLWNSKIVVLLLAALSACSIYPAGAEGVCPTRDGQPLRFVDVFDGAPQELATLMPDQAKDRSGFWELGYVYEAGRFVTLRCKYADGKALEVKLAHKVSRCDYTIDERKSLKLHCK